MKWIKLASGFSTDPKWRLVARKAEAPLAEVIAVAVHFLCDAAGSDGHVTACNDVTDVTLHVTADRVAAIRAAMHEGESPILVDNRFANWDSYQDPKTSKSATSAERVRRHRAKKAKQKQDDSMQGADVTACNDVTDVTLCNVTCNDVTDVTALDKNRIDKKRIKDPPPYPPGDATATVDGRTQDLGDWISDHEDDLVVEARQAVADRIRDTATEPMALGKLPDAWARWVSALGSDEIVALVVGDMLRERRRIADPLAYLSRAVANRAQQAVNPTWAEPKPRPPPDADSEAWRDLSDLEDRRKRECDEIGAWLGHEPAKPDLEAANAQ